MAVSGNLPQHKRGNDAWSQGTVVITQRGDMENINVYKIAPVVYLSHELIFYLQCEARNA